MISTRKNISTINAHRSSLSSFTTREYFGHKVKVSRRWRKLYDEMSQNENDSPNNCGGNKLWRKRLAGHVSRIWGMREQI